MILRAALEATWFLLPAGAANVAPVIAAWLFPTFDTPVDFRWCIRGRRLFGDHKTWRGMIAGIAAASAVFALQQALVVNVPAIQPYGQIDYANASWLLGAWMGAAALTGDLVKSTLKRQWDIAPGRTWFPFDQADWLIGTVVLTAPLLDLSWLFVLEILFVGVALHLLFHFLGYVLGLNRTPV